MKLRLWGCIVLIFVTTSWIKQLKAQSALVPLSQEYSHLVERFEIKSGRLSTDIHSGLKPFERKSVVLLTQRIDTSRNVYLSTVDKWNLVYLQNDSWEWLDEQHIEQSNSFRPILKYIYRKKSDFFHIQTKEKELDLHVTPIFHYGMGYNSVNGADSIRQLINTRGVEIRGILNKKLGFYTTFTENQVTYPAFIRSNIRATNGFPYEGFTKVVNNDSTRMLADYVSARGYIIFRPIKSLQLQFGHDRNFIGSGVRSLILSDFSAPYLQLKANVTVRNMQYMSIFAQLLNNQLARPANGSIPIAPKYLAFHHLNFTIGKNLNLGLFETIIFGKRAIGFDPNYLNPIILYRFVEGFLGSSDNVIIGLDAKWNFLRTASLYGQLVLDEFNLKANSTDANWWAKKYAAQVGFKYIDFLGIDNLDFQAEANVARPFIYSHFSTYSNYVHYNTPMAHPLGANFKELLLIGRYQPFPRIFVTFSYLNAIKGLDFEINGGNYGGDILRLNSDSRAAEYNNTIGQGKKTQTQVFDTVLSFMLRHNLFLEGHLMKRFYKIPTTQTQEEETYLSAAIRWNIGRKVNLY